MIYIDPLYTYPEAAVAGEAKQLSRKHDHRWCHLWTDPGNEEALHRMARSLGLKREWFQDRRGFPHYDLVDSRRPAALLAGAKETLLRDWILRTGFSWEKQSTSKPESSAGQ